MYKIKNKRYIVKNNNIYKLVIKSKNNKIEQRFEYRLRYLRDETSGNFNNKFLMERNILDNFDNIVLIIENLSDYDKDEISSTLDYLIDDWKFVDIGNEFYEDEDNVDSNSPFYFYTKQNLVRLQNYVFSDDEKKFIKDFFMGIIEDTLE